MKYTGIDEAYHNLANAIVISAARDYKKALIRLKRHPDSESAKRDVERNEKFFYSDWFTILTDVNPDYLTEKMKRIIDEKYGVEEDEEGLGKRDE